MKGLKAFAVAVCPDLRHGGARILTLAATLLGPFLRMGSRVHRAAIADTTRVRGLLHDAVATLQHSFNEVYGSSRNQHDEINRVLKALGTDNESDASVSIRHFVRHTEETLRYFTDLLAQISKQSMQASYKMDDMTQALDGMFGLLTGIDKVADQTNLLGVNALIAAAHAGEAGKGFNVVANEIRTLSHSSKDLNVNIRRQIDVARKAIDQTREIVREMASKDLLIALQAKDRVDTMLRKLVNLDSELGSALSNVDGAAKEVKQSVDAAVRALQFEDIASQVLAQVQTRLERLQPMTALLEKTVHSRGNESAEEVGERIQEAEAALAEMAAGDVDGQQVEQKSMAAGDVELF